MRGATEYRGVEQLEARRAHNPEVVGSSPASATITSVLIGFDILQEHSFFVTHFEPVRRSHTRHDGYSR